MNRVKASLDNNGIILLADEDLEFIESGYSSLPISKMCLAFFRELEEYAEFFCRSKKDLEESKLDENVYEMKYFMAFALQQGFAFRFRDNKYAVTFGDEGFFLWYPSNRPKGFGFSARKAILAVYDDCVDLSQERLKKALIKKNVAIRNTLQQELSGLFKLSDEIEALYQEKVSHRNEGIGEDDPFYSPTVESLEIQNSFTLKSEYEGEFEFEISNYIRGVFEAIEYAATLILPLWEAANTTEWQSIKKYAREKFIPDTWSTFILNNEDFKNFINLFFKVVKETNRDLADDYRSVKDDLRNVITHGTLTAMRLDRLVHIVPTLKTNRVLDPWFAASYNEINYFSFVRCKALLSDFLNWLRNLNPGFFYLITHDLDIPANAKELVDYVGNSEARASEFISKWNILVDSSLENCDYP